jgi:hypothetical protein
MTQHAHLSHDDTVGHWPFPYYHASTALGSQTSKLLVGSVASFWPVQLRSQAAG